MDQLGSVRCCLRPSGRARLAAYSRGHWVYTDLDWTWASDDGWGWATDHYGRWYFDPADGWVWVPGNEWAPAWVAWRYGGGYAGWAPLPPDATFDGLVGFDYGAIDPLWFSFVDEHFLIDVNLSRHLLPVARNVTCVRFTRNITNYGRLDQRIVNRGVDVHEIERVTGHPVARTSIHEFASPDDFRNARLGRNEIGVYRPAAAGPAQPDWKAGPAAAPRESTENLARRQKAEADRLTAAESRERSELARLHEQENRKPPAGVSPDDLRARHDAEMRAQQEHEQRERHVMQQRHDRERRH